MGRTRKCHSTISLAAALLASLSLAASASGSRAEHTTAEIESFDGNGIVQVLRQPDRFKVESADSYLVFSSLRWRGWGSRRAVARGTVKTCDYYGCTHSHAKLIADRRRRCLDDFSYLRMIAKEIPLYGTGPIELPVTEPGCATA